MGSFWGVLVSLTQASSLVPSEVLFTPLLLSRVYNSTHCREAGGLYGEFEFSFSDTNLTANSWVESSYRVANSDGSWKRTGLLNQYRRGSNGVVGYFSEVLAERGGMAASQLEIRVKFKGTTSEGVTQYYFSTDIVENLRDAPCVPGEPQRLKLNPGVEVYY